jgi:hypothetical protein
MKLYVYCLAEGIDVLEGPTLGISGASVRVLKTENLSVLVSDLDADSVLVTRENALTHAAVVRSVLDYSTPLPFRFGTVVTEQQLQSYVSTHKTTLESKLESVRGCVEMSVKIIWENPVAQQPESQDRTQASEQGAGTTFLAEKRQRILGDEHRAAEASKISTWLHETLRDLIGDEQVTLRPAERLVLSAAHLIERGKIGQYRERVAEMCQNRPDLHFLSSGPWPPYSFANIGLEFKTQIGVS